MKHALLIGLATTATLTNHTLYAQLSNVLPDTSLTHAGHFLFHIPAGWLTNQQGDQFSMKPPDLGPDEFLSFLLLTPTSDTNFQAAGDVLISQVAAALNAQPLGQSSGNGSFYFSLYTGQCLKGWDYSYGSGNIKISYRNPKDAYQNNVNFTIGVFLARLNGRMERVCYISKDYKCGIYSTTTSYKWTYGPVVDDFFFSLDFDDWQNVHRGSGKISAGGISGIWSGVAYMQGPQNSSTFQAGDYKPACFIFFDNGQVYYNSDWPHYGLFNLNTIAAAAMDPGHWGTYSWQGGSGVAKISWQTIPFSITGGRLTARLSGSPRIFEKLPASDDIYLNGNWCEFNGSACISFSADGRFSDNGVIRAIEHRPTTCNEALPEKGQGTYEVHCHSLVFHYSSGLTSQTALPGLGLEKGNPSPDKLILGWQNDVLNKK